MDGQRLTFQVSGLYEGLFVMRDAQTGSQWLHYTGECVDGPMAGRTLEMLAMNILDWPEFRRRHPGATVIDQSRSMFRRLMGWMDGARDVPSWFGLPGFFRRSMRRTESSVGDMEFGLGVVMGQRRMLGGVKAAGARFYPYRALKQLGLVQHDLGGTPVLVRWDAAANSAQAWVARLGDARPSFRAADGSLVDDRGNTYDAAGRVTAGPDAGQKLALLPAVATRWYGFHQTYPDAEVHGA